MKKILNVILSLVVMLSSFEISVVAYSGEKIATKSYVSVMINNEYENFDAYNIDGNNYFKLRDIAYILSNTEKQFDVVWNPNNNSIELTKGEMYSVIGGEMEQRSYENEVTAIITSSSVYLDGSKIYLTAYNIADNNYFKLRDIAKEIDFSVEWNDDTIYIDTAFGYVSEDVSDDYLFRRNVNIEDTTQKYIERWAHVSPIQQFKYMDEGIAYAYVQEDILKIVTPSNELDIKTKYPLLGDVISDDDGNFYVVWGSNNESNKYDTETVFISKYTNDGELVETTGFTGVSKMGDDGNTKEPFDAGNCVSAIHKNTMMVNYARGMYNGHQSNNVIGVNISNMEPVNFDSLWNIPYCSHSFNQDIIWSKKSNSFLYADHGDAYDRGFIITSNDSEKYIFHFYLEANANYDMFIVNETFAQLGGLAETSDGVVLVGASAKSISERAKKEKQNLFVQIFDPNKSKISKSMFVGGVERKGTMAFDINDNSNSPLTPVTDYGVIWLTDYTDRDVIAPQVVEADDNIVILWSENTDAKTEAFYIVLSSNGEIVTSKTSLGGVSLNSYEKPIYHNGKIYWVAAETDIIRVLNVEV